MSPPEKILISELPSDAVWLRLRLKFKEYDVEEMSEDENVYDLREAEDLINDEVYFWGRDGWANGFWHARIYLERSDHTQRLLVYAEKGSDPDCLELMPVRKKLISFMESCMSARELRQPVET